MAQTLIHKLDAWHQKPRGRLVFAAIELGLVYALGSWAINSGSVWLYLLALLLSVGFVKNLVLLAKRKRGQT
jgi:hypothetical protein